MARPLNDAITEKVAGVLLERRWACISEVAGELKIHWWTAAKHLERLVKEGRAVEYRKANIRLFGPTTSPVPTRLSEEGQG